MKRTWLIGAALVFSLSAVACGDDDGDDDANATPDSGVDGGSPLDSGLLDSGLDAARPDAGDAGDAG
jgi:hypothetical protein